MTGIMVEKRTPIFIGLEKIHPTKMAIARTNGGRTRRHNMRTKPMTAGAKICGGMSAVKLMFCHLLSHSCISFFHLRTYFHDNY